MTDPNPVAPKIAELGQKVRRIIAQGERQPANIDGPKTENQIRPEAAQPAQPFNRQRHTRNFIIFLQSLAIIALVAVAYGARKDLKAERETNAFLTSRPAPKGLSLSEVSQWRAQCGYLVGSHKSKAVDAFGVPTVDGSAVDFMMWLPSPKTGGRQISASLSHDWIVSVTVEPKPEEFLDFVTVMQKAEDFTFSGLWGAFVVTKKDGSAVLTYAIERDGLNFASIEFR